MDQQLIKVNNSVALSDNEKLRQALTQSKMVCDCEVIEVDRALSAIIERSIFYLGLNTPVADRDYIKELVLADVLRRFPRLTVDEVVAYIDNGAHGRYGDVRGLAPKDIFSWIVSGSTSQERKEVAAEIAKATEPAPEPTDEQKSQMAWSNLVNAWAVFKRDGSFNDHGNSVYTTLKVNGKINFTAEQMADFLRIAKADAIKELNPLNHVGNFVKIGECRALIEEIQLAGDKHGRVVAGAKKIALNHFFTELADMNMEITDLFF
jgi:hypothetical protein